MRISLITAIARNGVIGDKGRMPWLLQEDLRRFRSLTLGKAIIMGRKTHDSIGHALDGRVNIVMTHSGWTVDPRACPAASVEDALQIAKYGCGGSPVPYPHEAVVIGGAQIYEMFMPLVTRMYLTVLGRDFEGDTKLVLPCSAGWREVECEPMHDEKVGRYKFQILDKAG